MFPRIADSGLDFLVATDVVAHQSGPPRRKSLRSRTLGAYSHRSFGVPIQCDLSARRLLERYQGEAPTSLVQSRPTTPPQLLPHPPPHTTPKQTPTSPPN